MVFCRLPGDEDALSEAAPLSYKDSLDDTVCETAPLSFEEFKCYFSAIVQDEAVFQDVADLGLDCVNWD